MKVYFCMGWLSPSGLPPSLVGLSIVKHAGCKGEPAFRVSWWGECSFPVSFSSASYKHAHVVVCVCACMASFQPAVLEVKAHLITLTLCIYLLVFLFYFHNTFGSAGLFCQDEDDL